MDILKQQLAPVSNEAWEEIKKEAKRFLSLHLSARKFVEVEGPKGWDYAAVPSGRLVIPDNQDKKGVVYGINKVQPLIEPRIIFSLNIWELDNLTRGATDIDLDAMEEAARKLAEFEDKTVYYGLAEASLTGLKDCNAGEKLAFPENPVDLLSVVSQGITKLRDASFDGPYSLVVSPGKWQTISSHFKGYPLKTQLEKLLGGRVILSHFIEEAFLVPAHATELSLVLGHDISIGYESHSATEVRLYFTESFTFRINDPGTVIMIE
jgi:uncharacterized linocin/CFP29 family protein